MITFTPPARTRALPLAKKMRRSRSAENLSSTAADLRLGRMLKAAARNRTIHTSAQREDPTIAQQSPGIKRSRSLENLPSEAAAVDLRLVRMLELEFEAFAISPSPQLAAEEKLPWHEARTVLTATNTLSAEVTKARQAQKILMLVISVIATGIAHAVCFQYMLRRDSSAGNFCSFCMFCYVVLKETPRLRRYLSEPQLPWSSHMLLVVANWTATKLSNAALEAGGYEFFTIYLIMKSANLVGPQSGCKSKIGSIGASKREGARADCSTLMD